MQYVKLGIGNKNALHLITTGGLKNMSIETMSVQDMRSYKGTDRRPDDFEEFWRSRTDALSKLNISYELIPADFQVKGSKCSDLYFTSFDSSGIHCKVAVPDRPGRFPVLFYYHGYKADSLDWWHKVFWADRGFCIVAMDVRGQGGRSQDIAAGTGSTAIGHLASGIEGEIDDMTFAKVYKDIICMVNLVSSFSFTDETKLYVHGGSQGGALSLVTAALFGNVKKAAVLYPFLSDFRRVYALGAAGSAYEELIYIFRYGDPLHLREDEYFKKLAYIDVKNFAPMIKADVLMATGLSDEICPASTQFAVYNNLTCKKRHLIYPDFGHEPDLPGCLDECCTFLT